MSKVEFSKVEQSGHTQVVRRVVAGVFLMVLGTCLFASNSIFIKLAYEKGANPEAVLLFRQFFATPLFWIILMINQAKSPTRYQKGDMIKASLAGLLCFFFLHYWTL